MKSFIKVVLLLTLIGCSEVKKENEIVYKMNYYIPFDGSVQDVKLEDLFKDASYLPLQTNESCLLGRIERVVCKNGYVYIADCKSKGPEIFMFKENGRYSHKITHKGESSGDYMTFLNMNVSDIGNISMIERGVLVVHTYTTNDEFVSTIKLDSISLRDLAYLNDTTILIRSSLDQDGYKFHILNTLTNKITNSYDPVRRRRWNMYYQDCFATYSGKVLLCEYQSNEIVEVTKDSSHVRYVLNVGGKMPPAGFFDQDISAYDLHGKFAKKGYIGHIPCFAESDKSLLFRFQGGKDETKAFAFVDKATDHSVVFRRIILADGVVAEPTFFHSCGDGKVIFEVLPSTILESGNADFIAKFPGLEEESNPVLLFAEMK